MIDKILDGGMLEVVLNHALALDPQVAEKLLPLEGKTISIKLEVREEPWVLQVYKGRFVFEENTPNQECDVRLRGSFGGFMRLFDQNERRHGVNDKLYIEGDLHSAQQFQRVMASLSPDFERVLKNRFGEQLGAKIFLALEQLRSHGEQAKTEVETRLQSYFSGDDAYCVSRTEHTVFQQRVSGLRLALDRLEARIKKMES